MLKIIKNLLKLLKNKWNQNNEKPSELKPYVKMNEYSWWKREEENETVKTTYWPKHTHSYLLYIKGETFQSVTIVEFLSS